MWGTPNHGIVHTYGKEVGTPKCNTTERLTEGGHSSICKKDYKNSADADGGPRSRVHTAGNSAQPPIDVSGNLSAHVSA